MKLLRFAVFVMLFLVIMLPVCIAQSLEISSFAGKDSIQNYAKPDDTAVMKIKALIPRDLAISTSQIQVCKENLCSYPESCTPGQSFGKDIMNECIYTETLQDEHGIFEYLVKLLDDDGKTVKTLSTSLGIDNQPPKLFLFDIKPRETKDKAKIIIDVQDYGSDKGDAGYCSGIEKMDFYDKDSGKILLSKSYGPGQCDISDEFDYIHKSAKASEKINICAKAYDYFRQASEEFCVPFAFDNQGPVFRRLSLAEDDNPVSHISSQGGTFDLMLEIDDVSEVKSVIADLSKIAGKPIKKNFDYKKENTFYWKDFQITPSTVCEAGITAVDALGNSANASLKCALGIDETGPEVKNIRSNYEDYAGDSVIAQDTVITANILEEGVGLYKKDIYLDAKEIGVGVLQADECRNISDTMWECSWKDITPNVRDGDYQIRIDAKSRDDLGNPVKQVVGLDIIAYSEAPRITQISQYPVGPASDDTIKFTLRISNSKTEPGVFVDAAKISTDAFPKQADCVSAGIDEWECYVDIDMLFEAHDWINFYVKSGDTGKQEVPFEITIYEPEPAEGIDFFTITGTSILPGKGFDKRMVYTTSVPVYLQPRIKPKYTNKDLEIIETTAACSGDDVSEIYLVPGAPEKPYIVVKSAAGIAERTEPVNVECTLSLRVKQGNKIYKNPEIESFAVSIPVYNNPLGSVGENAQAQIDAINNRVRDLEKRAKQWSDINDWVGTIVSVAQYIAQADSTINYLVSALWLISTVLYELKSVPYIGPVLREIAQVLWQEISGFLYKNFHTTFVIENIWNPGMVGTEIFSAGFFTGAGKLSATLIKTVSIIYSCQLCDFSTSLYSGTRKLIYGDTTFDIDATLGEPTQIERFTVYDWDPYRSIHVAMGCLCMPGIVYNMRKEVQVNCIYRNCIEQNAELGLPFDSCEQAYKEQNCLYVDGAAWRVSGGSEMALLMNSLLTAVLDQIPLMISSKAWSYVCDPDCGMFGKEHSGETKGGDCGKYGMAPAKGSGESAYPDQFHENPEKDWRVAVCGAWGSTQTLMETDFFGTNKVDWNKYASELEGEDYCD